MGQLKLIQFKVTKGMQLDVDPLVASTDTAYRLFNLKTQVIDGLTETALTNEKGNTLVSLKKYIKNEDGTFDDSLSFTITGTIVGCIQCTTDTSVIFTYINSTTLAIIRLSGKEGDLNTIRCKILAKGDFSIEQNANISGLFVYENSELLKIYWVDGVNLLRYLNIADSNELLKTKLKYIVDSNLLETSPKFNINHSIEVNKLIGTGKFPSGVLLYAFTYYNKYGSETSLVDITPLYYIGEDSRGLPADEYTSCSYEIIINNPDTSFNYLRLYSIIRTSLNGTPIVKIVKDLKLDTNNNSTDYKVSTIDNNEGDTVDSTSLLFKNNRVNIYKTLELKDNTLFLSNYKESNHFNKLKTIFNKYNLNISEINSTKTLSETPNLVLNSQLKRFFKKGEQYLFGLVCISNKGEHSLVMYIDSPKSPTKEPLTDGVMSAFNVTLPELLIEELKIINIIGVIPVVAVNNEPTIIGLGFISTTISNKWSRGFNLYFPSWYLRPYLSKNTFNNFPLKASTNWSNTKPDDWDTSQTWNSNYIWKNTWMPTISTGNTGNWDGVHGKTIDGREYGVLGIRRLIRGGYYNELDLSTYNYWAPLEKYTYNDSSDRIGGVNNNKWQTIPQNDGTNVYWSGRFKSYIEFRSWDWNNYNQNYSNTAESQSAYTEGWQKSYSQYDNNDNYISDINLLTFNSPEIETGLFTLNSLTPSILKLKQLIGIIDHDGLTRNVNYIEIETNGLNLNSKLMSKLEGTLEPFRSSFIWKGYLPAGDKVTEATVYKGDITKYTLFPVFLWLRGALGAEDADEAGKNFTIKTKKVFSYLKYYGKNPFISQTPVAPSLQSTLQRYYKIFSINSDISISNYIIFDGNKDIDYIDNNLYMGNTNYIETFTEENPYWVIAADDTYTTFKNNKPIITSIDGSIIKYSLSEDVIEPRTTYRNIRVPRTNAEKDYGGVKFTIPGKCTDPIHISYRTSPHIVIKPNEAITNPFSNYPWLLYTLGDKCIIGELYILKERTIDEDYLASCTWIKCGDLKKLTSNTTVIFEEGDYFYGRFDSLRVYPYSKEDVNLLTEIVSSMLCSKINLDARTDRNREVSTPTVTPENFNKFNRVYDLINNYLTFRYIKDTVLLNRLYNSSVQWSLTKQYGEEVDTWCNILDINTLDFDGNNGLITALKKYNNTLYCFLESGISLILFNDNVQVSSTAGTPIEIANSGKVLGKRYITESLGCMRDKAITITPNAMYFIDGLNKRFYAITSQSLLPLDICSMYKMKSWALNNLDKDWWCYYDMYSLEVLLANLNTCLSFNDKNQLFSSFLSYPNIKYTFNSNGREYLINNNSIWLKNSKKNTNIFGTNYSQEITYIANAEPTLDKTFSTVEYRADVFDNNTYLANKSFTSLRLYNEYQDTGSINLVNTKDKPSILKKKFRNWYITIPRHSANRDRIRNPWCYVTLTNNNQDTSNIILYDTKVTYFT